MPDHVWDPAKNAFKDDAGDYFTQVLARDATEQARRAQLPKAPEEYQISLPAEFKAPEGMEYQFDDKNPALGQLRQVAHKHGLSQDVVSELLGVYAGVEVGGLAQVNTAKAAELAKLGPAASSRVDNVSTWLKAVGGEDFAALANVLKLAPVAGTITGLEKLMVKMSSQGGAPFSQQHRDVQPQGRVSEDQYYKMSPADRLEYSRQFDQSQFQKSA